MANDYNILDQPSSGGGVTWADFTPTLIGVTSAGVGTYTAQNGRVALISDTLVNVWIMLTWTAHTGTGYMRIAGLPYTIAPHNTVAVIRQSSLVVGAGLILTAIVYNGLTEIALGTEDSTGASAGFVTMDTAGAIALFASYEKG